jgi:transposase
MLLRVGFHQELLSAAAIEIGSKEKTPLAKTVRTCRKLLQVESALWTFVYHDSIEPTNNSAERALRSAVIWRNLSFGSQSSEGSKFVARMLTVNCSLNPHSAGKSGKEIIFAARSTKELENP